MQQSDFEIRNRYQLVPIGIAAVIAVMIGCLTHFFKIESPNIQTNTMTLFTALGTLLLYGYDLMWMKDKIAQLKDAVSMADVRFSKKDRNILIVNVVIILCYIFLSFMITPK